MAKKTTSKKPNTKATKKPAQPATKALAKGLKQPPLGGMSRARNTRLDKLAEAVGECRDAINLATSDIRSFRAAALKEMIDKELSFWSHGGVDFIVTPGEPELKIKTHKDKGGETGGADLTDGDDDGDEAAILQAILQEAAYEASKADDGPDDDLDDDVFPVTE